MAEFSFVHQDLSRRSRYLRGNILISIVPLYLTQEGKEELFEEWGEAGFQGVNVGIAEQDPLAAGVGAGDDLDSAQGKAQHIGQQAAAGCIGLPLDRPGTDRHGEDPLPDSDDLVPPRPRPDEHGEQEIRSPCLEV
jgi:hypothetical protein